MSRRSQDNYVSPEWNLGKMQRTLGKICRTAANLDNYSNRMFFWIIIVFSSREEKFFFTCEEKFFFTCEEKFFHTLSLIKGCEEKKSERLENGYCPVEKTMIIQEKVCENVEIFVIVLFSEVYSRSHDNEKSNEWPLPKTIRYGTIGRMPQGILYHRISHIGVFSKFSI